MSTRRQPRNSRVNVRLVIGIILILVFAVAAFVILTEGKASRVTVLVPTSEIGAFQRVDQEDLEAIEVLEDDAITQRALTQSDFDELTDGGTVPVYSATTLLAGQLVSPEAFSSNPQNSYQIVRPDEELIGVTTTLSGAVAGTIRPGSIVRIVPDDNGGLGTPTTAKVLCIGQGEQACAGIGGVREPIAGEDAEGIVSVLAVSQDDAANFAGKEVTMSLVPFCEAVAGGDIKPRDKADAGACAQFNRGASE